MLFDFDGTLVDSEYLHHESWLEAVAPWGVTVSWEEYVANLVGISDLNACEYFLGLAGMAATPEALDRGRALKHRAYRARSVRELTVEPAAVEWILQGLGTIPMGVVSSSAVPDVVPILERQGIAHCMEFIICGDHVDRLKPDPAPYRLALAKLASKFGIDNGRDCLVFEDSSTGIRSARAAGMTVHALGDPRDLPAALAAWDARIARMADSGSGGTCVPARAGHAAGAS